MIHLWSLATWDLVVTHDAGQPEWIDAPISTLEFGVLSISNDHYFDGEKWVVSLPQQLHLLTAWYMDELCEHLYMTCIDPQGRTLTKQLIEIEVHEDLPKIHLASIPLSHLWYTEDGFYKFTFAYFYGGLPYQHTGSFRLLLSQGE